MSFTDWRNLDRDPEILKGQLSQIVEDPEDVDLILNLIRELKKVSGYGGNYDYSKIIDSINSIIMKGDNHSGSNKRFLNRKKVEREINEYILNQKTKEQIRQEQIRQEQEATKLREKIKGEEIRKEKIRQEQEATKLREKIKEEEIIERQFNATPIKATNIFSQEFEKYAQAEQGKNSYLPIEENEEEKCVGKNCIGFFKGIFTRKSKKGGRKSKKNKKSKKGKRKQLRKTKK
jgi:hypothetical protein